MIFTYVPSVKPGAPITSTNAAKLARAANEKLRFDGGQRLAYYFLGLVSRMRNPSEDGMSWAALGEFYHAYVTLSPESATWPTNPAGTAEGISVENPVGALTFGNDRLDIDSEATRMGQYPWPTGSDSISSAWAMMKSWRGACDTSTQAVNCPAWKVAQTWCKLRYSTVSAMGTTSGGYQPTPQILGPCDDPDRYDSYPPPTNYEIKFTPTAEGVARGYGAKVYAGTCQPGPSVDPPNKYDEHVAAYWLSLLPQPGMYIVVLNNGHVDYLPADCYIEGPYDGPPCLRRTEGHQLLRAIHQYARMFRGTNEQTNFPNHPSQWIAWSFDFRKFLSQQYVLAPARGKTVGGVVVAETYPSWQKDGSAGLTITGGTPLGDVYIVHTAFTIPLVLVTASKLAGPVTISGTTGGSERCAMTLEPDANGNAEGMLRFPQGMAGSGARMQINVKTTATFTDASGQIFAEGAELWSYLPDVSDLGFILRAASAQAVNY